jgi:hypothetical protein
MKNNVTEQYTQITHKPQTDTTTTTTTTYPVLVVSVNVPNDGPPLLNGYPSGGGRPVFRCEVYPSTDQVMSGFSPRRIVVGVDGRGGRPVLRRTPPKFLQPGQGGLFGRVRLPRRGREDVPRPPSLPRGRPSGRKSQRLGQIGRVLGRPDVRFGHLVLRRPVLIVMDTIIKIIVSAFPSRHRGLPPPSVVQDLYGVTLAKQRRRWEQMRPRRRRSSSGVGVGIASLVGLWLWLWLRLWLRREGPPLLYDHGGPHGGLVIQPQELGLVFLSSDGVDPIPNDGYPGFAKIVVGIVGIHDGPFDSPIHRISERVRKLLLLEDGRCRRRIVHGPTVQLRYRRGERQ